MFPFFAEVAELADAPGSGPGGVIPVGVQIPSSASFAVLLSFLLSLIFVYVVKKLAIKYKILDIPSEKRKIHKIPTPTMGGIGIIISFFISSILLYFLTDDLSAVLLFLLSLPLIAICIIDDIKGTKAWIKLLVQIVSSILFVIIFPITSFLRIPLYGTITIPAILMKVISIFWLVAIINSINLIDGMDGLAAGISLIATSIFAIASVLYGNYLFALIALILAGSILGFLIYNFPPAKIFMGDTGSNFIGFILGGIALLGAGKMVSLIGLLIPIFTLSIPIFDTIMAVLRRFKSKTFFTADKKHLHHRLMFKGFSNIRTLLLLYSLTFGFGMLSLLIINFSWIFIGGTVIGIGGAVSSFFLRF